ncbi:cation:proton antiporter [Lyngbya confervoides]|uniref:Cation:proton antiporter n=1 Tax=Lyngbya confervoides BDU141951 TaxID=1574623 RepID=A0ABD4T3Y0_9CYAN|nr:sodium:proton antiporter [Lyngbya confervoides]MCM1983432.1 cation:proton antiporter [Lyngbya confervoides BDU141951]
MATELAIEENLKSFLLVLSVSLSVATLPQVFSWFRQIPYTLLLVIVGLGLAFVDIRLVNLSPELILSIFLPPLLFEAAWNLRWANLKKDWIPIGLYAVIGVVVAIAGISFGVNRFAGLPLTSALLIGASLSATDPVSVTALFRELGADKRLTTLMEGESLFNDGMAVVAFGLLFTIAFGSGSVSVQGTVLELVTVVGIGVAVGGLIGFGISYLTQRFDLPLVEQSLTLVAAYGTYIITEDLGGSGVIGVVTTALILGNFGSRIGMNPRTRIIVSEFWEFLAFFVNSIVFLLIGDQVQFPILLENLPTIMITIVAMTLARAVAVFGLGALSNYGAKSDISLPVQIILWWGGLRGSVSIALALSLPIYLSDRETVIATVFGVVLFTLLVQGLSTKPMLLWLRLAGDQPLQQLYSEAVARQLALRRSLERLREAQDRPGVDKEFLRYQETLISGEIERLSEKVVELREEHPNLVQFMENQLKSELLAVEAESYAEFVQAGWLNRELAPFLQSGSLSTEN